MKFYEIQKESVVKDGILSRWKESLHFFSGDMLKKEAFLWWRHLQLAVQAVWGSRKLLIFLLFLLMLPLLMVAFIFFVGAPGVALIMLQLSYLFTVSPFFTLLPEAVWAVWFFGLLTLFYLLVSRPSVLSKTEVFRSSFLSKGLLIGLVLVLLNLVPRFFLMAVYLYEFSSESSSMLLDPARYIIQLIEIFLAIAPTYSVFVGFFLFDATEKMDWLRAFWRAAKMLWFNVPVAVLLVLMSFVAISSHSFVSMFGALFGILFKSVFWGFVVLLYGIFYSFWTIKNYEMYFEATNTIERRG